MPRCSNFTKAYTCAIHRLKVKGWNVHHRLICTCESHIMCLGVQTENSWVCRPI